MTETSIMATLIGAEFGVLLALVGVVWAMLQGRISTLEKGVESLQAQNTSQETAIGRLTERAIAREEAHAQHREDMQAQFARIDTSMAAINAKLDRLLGGRTPYPTGYRGAPGSEGSGERR